MLSPNDESEEKGVWAMVGLVFTIVLLLVYPVLEAKGLI